MLDAEFKKIQAASEEGEGPEEGEASPEKKALTHKDE